MHVPVLVVKIVASVFIIMVGAIVTSSGSDPFAPKCFIEPKE